MTKQEIINKLQHGDSILIDYTKELNKFEDEEDIEDIEEIEVVKKLTLVLEVSEDALKLKDSSNPFPFVFSKKYLLNSELELTFVENY
jgi:hypothetical protein